jgi:hypothetical protein
MEKIPNKRLGAQTPEGKPRLPAELAVIMDNEAVSLGVETANKKGEKPNWRRKAGAVFLGITILASAMAGTAKEAKAGEGFNFSQRAAQEAQHGLNRYIDNLFQGSQEQRQREQNRRDQIFNAQLEIEKRAIQQQADDRNKIRELNIEQVRQEIQQINNRINTYEQVKVEAIRKINDPNAERQIRLCEGEIAKLEKKREAYQRAATGISPAQAPRREYKPMSPSSTSPPQGTFIRRGNMPPQTPPPPPQMRPSPGYSASSPASRGEWRPMPPQTPPPPPMQPRQNRPVSPPLSYDGKPLPPLPDL